MHASENESLNNPIIYRCNKCKKAIYLRDHTIYGKFPRTPALIIPIIIKLWIIDEKNTTQIFEKLTNNSGIRISTIQTVRNILTILKQCIAHYFKDKYEIELLATENENKKFAVDETLITHINGHQVWLVGIINTQTKDFRLIPVYNRNYTILNYIITKFVEKGNVLISDSWAGYNGFYFHLQNLDIFILSIIMDMVSLVTGMNLHPSLKIYGQLLNKNPKIFIILFLPKIFLYF